MAGANTGAGAGTGAGADALLGLGITPKISGGGGVRAVVLASADVLASDARFDENTVGNAGTLDGPPNRGMAGVVVAFASLLAVPNEDSKAKLMPVEGALGTGRPALPLEDELAAGTRLGNEGLAPKIGKDGNDAGTGALLAGSGNENDAPNAGNGGRPAPNAGAVPEPNTRPELPPKVGTLAEAGVWPPNAPVNAEPKADGPAVLEPDFRTLAMRRLASSESSATAKEAGLS